MFLVKGDWWVAIPMMLSQSIGVGWRVLMTVCLMIESGVICDVILLMGENEKLF